MSAPADLLHGALDGDLTDAQQRELEELLARSAAARADLVALARLEQLIRAGLTPARPSIRDAVMAQIRRERGIAPRPPAPRPLRRMPTRRPRSPRTGPWRRRTRVAGTGAVAAVLLLSVGWWAWRSPVTPPPATDLPVVVTAVAAVMTTGTASTTLTPGMALPLGAEVQVRASGTLVLRYADGTQVTGASPTRCTIEPGPGKAVLLQAGALAAVVAHQPVSLPFVLRTPVAQATVVGTELELQADAGSTRLRVRSGTVRFQRLDPAAELLVRTGEQATVSPGTPFVTQPLLATPPTPAAPAATAAAGTLDAPLGTGAIFAADDPWNQPITALPVAADSERLLATMGATEPLRPAFGRPRSAEDRGGYHYLVVGADQPGVPVSFTTYPEESDPGPYPLTTLALAACDSTGATSHVLLVATAGAGMPRRLYELLGLEHLPDGRWQAVAGAVFDATGHDVRRAGWTSACGSGLPIFPGLIRYEEVAAGRIAHALRFTMPRTRRGFLLPASHAASLDPDPTLPPMGLRLRLRAAYPVAREPARIQVILRALQTYGMFLSDHGAAWSLSGVGDPRWSPEELDRLRLLHGRDFDVVDTGPVITPP